MSFVHNFWLEGRGQTVGTGQIVLCSLPLVAGRSYSLSGAVVGRAAGGETIAVSVSGAAKRTGGTSAAVATPDISASVADALLGAAVVTVDVNVAGNAAQLLVTGVLGQTIDWAGDLRGKEFEP